MQGHAGACKGMQGHARACKCMHGHARACKGMQGHAGACKGRIGARQKGACEIKGLCLHQCIYADEMTNENNMKTNVIDWHIDMT